MALARRVLGYHAGWSEIAPYRYDLLSTVAYVGYDVDPDSGSYTSLHGWDTTTLVEDAHAGGAKIVLTAQLMDPEGNRKLLSDPNKRATLIQTLLATVQARGGDGVNIDLEEVPGDQRDNFTQLMKDLAAAFHDAIPGSEVSAALPALKSKAYDLTALGAVCDYALLMGYDYAWSTAPNAGPVAPLGGGGANVTLSVDMYLAADVPPGKLLLGVPYYGYDWKTESQDPRAKVIKDGNGNIVPGIGVSYVNNLAQVQKAGRNYDAVAASPWYAYADDGGQSHVAWYDDAESLAAKYALVNARNLAGIGIWTLDYQGQLPDLWDAIEAAFAAGA